MFKKKIKKDIKKNSITSFSLSIPYQSTSLKAKSRDLALWRESVTPVSYLKFFTFPNNRFFLWTFLSFKR